MKLISEGLNCRCPVKLTLATYTKYSVITLCTQQNKLPARPQPAGKSGHIVSVIGRYQYTYVYLFTNYLACTNYTL